MDDIARDPNVDAQVAPVEHGQGRLKGPVPEFAVEESMAGDEDGTPALRSPARLPRVLPLAPSDDVDDDLLGAPGLGADEEDEDGADEDGAPDARARAASDADEVAVRAGADGEDDGPAGDGEAGDADQQAARPVPEPGAEPSAAAPITDSDQLVRVVFGLLLTNREGLSTLRLAQVCDTTQEAVRAALAVLRAELAASHAPLELNQSGEAFKLWTTPDVFPYLEKLRGIRKNERLSPAALETLAVIAYRQPVFRAEIEAIRGVKVGPMLRTLLDCKLVKVVGRADVPGRPLQYGTTQQFLERFGLSSLADLPSVKEFKGLSG